ncbi:hypothetical protein Ddye_030197 [Dipteronia dyeriana]|uniref:Uncharacterized protein n=1 Tax=Dipteronia dyeriana TaxID=168575 RepID=A0AAD9TFW1_9ROSI|nr:hypothetical protein Ddye_030197 [Dipteronia dyeriana]
MMDSGEVVRRRRRCCGGGGRVAISMFIWVILIFSQLSLVFALLHHDQSFKSPPRKARFFHSTDNDDESFHAPPTMEKDPDSLYEDDKRIIHTGPNPLHN